MIALKISSILTLSQVRTFFTGGQLKNRYPSTKNQSFVDFLF